MMIDAFADHLDELSHATWYNLTEAKRLGMRMGEVTITEANLLSIARFVAENGLSAQLVPTKADEAVTGADFEIWFDIDIGRRRVIGYTFQAKVLTVGKTSCSYREIGRTDAGGTKQADLLECHAFDVGAFPFHVLFNGWASGHAGAPGLDPIWPPEHFGCAAVATPEVSRILSLSPTRRSWRADPFLGAAVPWSELFRTSSGETSGLGCVGLGRAIDETKASDAGGRRPDVLIDVPALARRARELTGDNREFGWAAELPEYVLQGPGRRRRMAPASRYVPRFALVMRQV